MGKKHIRSENWWSLPRVFPHWENGECPEGMEWLSRPWLYFLPVINLWWHVGRYWGVLECDCAGDWAQIVDLMEPKGLLQWKGQICLQFPLLPHQRERDEDVSCSFAGKVSPTEEERERTQTQDTGGRRPERRYSCPHLLFATYSGLVKGCWKKAAQK